MKITVVLLKSVIVVKVIKLCGAFSVYSPLQPASKKVSGVVLDAAPDVKSKEWFFASTEQKEPPTTSIEEEQRRVLGSQELLMLPRQYGPTLDKVTFPQMNHVSCAVLSATPSTEHLKIAVEDALQAHPLLQAWVDGDGQPDRRIDLFQMVREGEPNPLTFVATPGKYSADDIVNVVDIASADALEASWKAAFGRDLDDGSWCNVKKGPLWKVELHRTNGKEGKASDESCALLISFNHAISDQSSANRLTDQIVKNLADLEDNGAITNPTSKQKIPVALEDSVLGEGQRWNDIQSEGVSLKTIQYVAGKTVEEFRAPVLLPDSASDGGSAIGNPLSALTVISGQAAGGEDSTSAERKSTLQFRSLSEESTQALLEACRKESVSVSNALTAAMTLTASDFICGESQYRNERNYKILQSLDMRRYGEKLDRGETVACMAGSMDLVHGPLNDKSGQSLRQNPTVVQKALFWNLAREGKTQTNAFIENDKPREAVRVFDFAMSISDLTNLVYWKGQSKDDKGRAYSAGVTNVGVYERQAAFAREGDSARDNLKTAHGRYKVEDVYFATPHTQSGSLYQVSCQSQGAQLKFTFSPVEPIVSEETNRRFADAFVELLEIIAGTKDSSDEILDGRGALEQIPENSLVLITSLVGLAAVFSHAPAWAAFFQSVMQMKANTPDSTDFWAALNFWIFFAVGHPILQPILWISDVLHGTPGPKIADLVPALFVAGNLAFIGAITVSKKIRDAVNVAALAAFFTYVGAGLDGKAGLGDYNLALDDRYNGQIVQGCPAYEDVRQPSMNDFDLKKYQGLWYEQKFHDWTQFKEVYDTTLGIKLTDGGDGWIDDFAVKGPAPDSAKLSWDKSPVANGAHYFLFGRVDTADPPGVLRESGFGVEFPNYIVDVKKDSSGEYTEAIQFQCLERGGVRVFEGINFMSRNPTMTDQELTAMHARAEKAGMYPYGAAPEQMHTVARRPVGAPDIDNSWQAMWRAIGVDKLLELLTKSIEDGGR